MSASCKERGPLNWPGERVADIVKRSCAGTILLYTPGIRGIYVLSGVWDGDDD